jgi:hypothetical protein
LIHFTVPWAIPGAHLSLLGLHCNKKAAPLVEGGASHSPKNPHLSTAFLLYHDWGRNPSEPRPANPSEDAIYPYTLDKADEDTLLEEAMDDLKEAGQRIRATQSLMRSQGMTDGENYRDLLTRLSAALAMTEAAYLEARRRREL